MNNKIALVLCLDQNKDNKYEYECLYCIKCWTRKLNTLANVDIIIYVKENVAISTSTVKELLKYKNISFYKYSYPYKHNHVLLNKLYCWYLFEKYETLYQYGIYIDLDLYLTHTIPTNFLFNGKNVFCIYKELDKTENLINYRIKNNQQNNIYTFNTQFIVNNRKNKIFEKLVSFIDNEGYESFFNDNIFHDSDMFYYEEGIYDYAFSLGIINSENSNFIDVKKISGMPDSFFVHKHIKSLHEYVRLYNKVENNK